MPQLKVSISPIAPLDIPAVTALSNAAFLDDPLHIASKPAHMTPEQVEEYNAWREEGFVNGLENPNSHYFEAVDGATGEIVGVVGWGGSVLKADGQSPAKEGEVGKKKVARPAFLNEEVFKGLGETMGGIKEGVVGGRVDFWTLQTITTHPDYQRQGIGRQLVMHGLEYLVDPSSLDCFVQASTAGAGLYEACGFERMETRTISGIGVEVTGLLRRGKKADVTE